MSNENIPPLDPLVQSLLIARKQQGFTQTQVAAMTGISRRTLVDMESGGNCTIKTLRQIAQGLGVILEAKVPTQDIPTLDEVMLENNTIYYPRETAR